MDTAAVRKDTKRHALVKRLGVTLAVMLAILAGVTVFGQKQASAASGRCAWYGLCTVDLTRSETNVVAAAGIGAVAARLGVPPVVAGAVGSAAGAAASEATAHGYCLTIKWHPMLPTQVFLITRHC